MKLLLFQNDFLLRAVIRTSDGFSMSMLWYKFIYYFYYYYYIFFYQIDKRFFKRAEKIKSFSFGLFKCNYTVDEKIKIKLPYFRFT